MGKGENLEELPLIRSSIKTSLKLQNLYYLTIIISFFLSKGCSSKEYMGYYKLNFETVGTVIGQL